MPPQPGQIGLPSVSGQRRRRNTSTTSPSDMRTTFAALSERAAAESRKCCAMATCRTRTRVPFLPEEGPQYKPNFAGGACYIRPDIYARLRAWGYRHKTVCHGRGEYARDEDGDGFCE